MITSKLHYNASILKNDFRCLKFTEHFSDFAPIQYFKLLSASGSYSWETWTKLSITEFQRHNGRGRQMLVWGRIASKCLSLKLFCQIIDAKQWATVLLFRHDLISKSTGFCNLIILFLFNGTIRQFCHAWQTADHIGRATWVMLIFTGCVNLQRHFTRLIQLCTSLFLFFRVWLKKSD